MGRGSDTEEEIQARRNLLIGSRRINQKKTSIKPSHDSDDVISREDPVLNNDLKTEFKEDRVPSDLPPAGVNVDPGHAEILKGIPTYTYGLLDPFTNDGRDFRHIFDSGLVGNLRRDQLPEIFNEDRGRILPEMVSWEELDPTRGEGLGAFRGMAFFDQVPAGFYFFDDDSQSFVFYSSDEDGALVPTFVFPVLDERGNLRIEYEQDPQEAFLKDFVSGAGYSA